MHPFDPEKCNMHTSSIRFVQKLSCVTDAKTQAQHLRLNSQIGKCKFPYQEVFLYYGVVFFLWSVIEDEKRLIVNVEQFQTSTNHNLSIMSKGIGIWF